MGIHLKKKKIILISESNVYSLQMIFKGTIYNRHNQSSAARVKDEIDISCLLVDFQLNVTYGSYAK